MILMTVGLIATSFLATKLCGEKQSHAEWRDSEIAVLDKGAANINNQLKVVVDENKRQSLLLALKANRKTALSLRLARV